MGLRELAEGIILQSMEDLWSEDCREECLAFFRSRDFSVCAETAGMGLMEQVKILNMVKGVIEPPGGMKKTGNGTACRLKRKKLAKWRRGAAVSLQMHS